MIYGINEQDFMAYIIFGLLLNFVFSILFGIYLTKNIGMQDMLESKGDKQQSLLVGLSLFVPFAKMGITLYRVAILQLYFLNKGHSHKEFWVYMTNK